MTDAPTPHRAASAEERERLAAWLLGRDEAGAADEIDHYARHFAGCLPRWINEHHSGDCTKESHSCVRCIAERTYADTDDLIAKHLAPLLDRITAAEARAEELQGLLVTQEICAARLTVQNANLRAVNEAATADRDRLADEVARLRSTLDAAAYLIDRLEACHAGKCVRDLDEATSAYETARALTARGDGMLGPASATSRDGG